MSEKFTGGLKCFVLAELTERGAVHGGTDVRSKLGISMQLFPSTKCPALRDKVEFWDTCSRPGECRSVRNSIVCQRGGQSNRITATLKPKNLSAESRATII